MDNFFVDSAGRPIELQFSQCLAGDDAVQRLIDQGAAAAVVSYQPGNRYWLVQATEAGISVFASAVILGLGLGRLRRRMH